jgi:Flp pilus assembly protein CpaB
LPEGSRAIGVRVSTEGIAGGFASLPGSHVDVVSTVRRGSGDDSFSQVLLEDVPVLAAAGANKANEAGGAMPASVVTLGLNSEDALKVTLASQLGPLHVMVRKHGDKTRTEKDRVTVTQVLRGPDNSSYFRPGEVLWAEVGGKLTKGGGEPRSDGKTNVNTLNDAASFENLAEKKTKTAAGAVPAVAQQQKEPPVPQAPESPGRKIIRSGEMDFEVDSFDNAVAVITRLIAPTRGGFIATINSEKLPNGKVRGSVVVRMPPEKLDTFVLNLRTELAKMGDLKGQRIGSQDITKQYTDLESRLRAARSMEERLLKIIKEGKGQIKDLIVA